MINIAIDGPSGAGKSTIAKLLSKDLGILYLDTGAMYRAVGLKALTLNINPSDEASVKKFLPTTIVAIKFSNGEQQIYLDGVNVSLAIREHHVSKAASDISAIPAVRLKLVELQRQIAGRSNCILDGRDIGTYVLPNANFKFFLTASPLERARRRYAELKEKGQNIELEKIIEDINERDKNDSTRAFAPLKKANDAIEIDTTFLTIEDVVEKIKRIVEVGNVVV